MNRPCSSSSSSCPPSSSDDLERKLQGIESSLRQERETARRQKQLAAERLRLLQQEFDSMDKTVQGLQHKLQSIQGEVSTVLVPELHTMRINVGKLTQEVDFQHQQLIQKRNKTKDLHEALIVMDRKQSGTVQRVRQTIHQRRSAASSSIDENKEPNLQVTTTTTTGRDNDKNGHSKQTQGSRGRHQDLSDAASIKFWKDLGIVSRGRDEGNRGGGGGGSVAGAGTVHPSLPRLIFLKADRMQTQATRMEHGDTAPLQRIVTGYKKHLQLTTTAAAPTSALTNNSTTTIPPPPSPLRPHHRATAMMHQNDDHNHHNNNNTTTTNDHVDAFASNQE